MNNFTAIMEKNDSWEIMVDDVTNYLNKVNKKMLPLNVRDAIYFTKKYNLLSRESIEEIRDASKGSLKTLSKKYNIPEVEIESFWKLLKDLKDNIVLMPQMQTDEEREMVILGQLSKDDLTIDLTTPRGRNAAAKVYTPLVIKIVSQYVGKSKLSKQELMSAGLEGLTAAMNEWDKTKSTFKTYASYRIQQQILNDINGYGHSLSGTSSYSAKKGVQADAYSLDGLLGMGEDGDYKQDRLAALGTTGGEYVDKEKQWEPIYKLIEDNFKSRDVEIFYRLYGLRGYKKEKSKDIAKEFGWSEGNIRNSVINKILNFLRKDRRAIQILTDIQDAYNESLLNSLWGLNKQEIIEALVSDDIFILLEELNRWKNKSVFVNSLNYALEQLTSMDADYIKSVLSNDDFEFLDGSFKKHKKVIMEFLNHMYPSESIARKTDVSLLEYMTDLQDAWKLHKMQ
jgi:RNA polymerase sigma factor (sigma-70 family)